MAVGLVLLCVVLVLFMAARLASVGNIPALCLAVLPVLFLWAYANTAVGPAVRSLFF